VIKLKNYSINNLTLTNEQLESYINNFWVDIFNNIKDTSHLMLMCKVQFTDEATGYRTLGNLRKVNFEDKELFIEYLTQRLSILSDSYVTLPISNIIFSYIIKEGQTTENRALLQDLTDRPNTNHSFNNMVLPISMNVEDYGNLLASTQFETFTRYIVTSGSRIYKIEVSLDGLINNVTILGHIDLSWTNTKISEATSDIFKREIKKSTIYFMDGEIVLRKQILPAKPFKSLKVDSKQVNDFHTLDIETINENGKLIPYLICAYDGSNYITSYGKDQKALFTSFFEQLISNIKAGTTYVYAHNLSGFDGIFLMKHLLEFGKVEPLLFNGKLISI
jgi:hypothetical protein